MHRKDRPFIFIDLHRIFRRRRRRFPNGPSSIKTTEQSVNVEFTPEKLQKYNGMDGNPAYVAVNGAVYDVTNNAAWAAASHFGLKAGRDLSATFSSCHGDKNVLRKLKPVGKLVQPS